ncbi:MAG: winged helix-turn-helix domain-containing protein [Planctomycetota bacterium]
MSIRDAIIKVLSDAKGEDVQLQDIYRGVHRVYKVSDYQEEPDPKYGQKLIEQEIRSILAKLKNEGAVERPERGYYRIK